MKREQIFDTLKALARSQGFYGRVLEQLEELPDDDYENVMDELEKCSDPLDLVMFFEG